MSFEVSEDDQYIREKLLDILQGAVARRCHVSITLRNGTHIQLPETPRAPEGLSPEERNAWLYRAAYSDVVDVCIEVGKDYVEVTTGGSPAIFTMTPISEIVSVQYF